MFDEHKNSVISIIKWFFWATVIGLIVGVLDEVDDYDFLLSNVTRAPQGRRKSVQSFYRPLGRKRAAVDRSQVLYVQEYFSA